MEKGVVDVAGTYSPSALPDPLDQLAKIFKVVFQTSTRQLG